VRELSVAVIYAILIVDYGRCNKTGNECTYKVALRHVRVKTFTLQKVINISYSECASVFLP
jgi:hypothetical protein